MCCCYWPLDQGQDTMLSLWDSGNPHSAGSKPPGSDVKCRESSYFICIIVYHVGFSFLMHNVFIWTRMQHTNSRGSSKRRVFIEGKTVPLKTDWRTKSLQKVNPQEYSHGKISLGSVRKQVNYQDKAQKDQEQAGFITGRSGMEHLTLWTGLCVPLGPEYHRKQVCRVGLMTGTMLQLFLIAMEETERIVTEWNCWGS